MGHGEGALGADCLWELDFGTRSGGRLSIWRRRGEVRIALFWHCIALHGITLHGIALHSSTVLLQVLARYYYILVDLRTARGVAAQSSTVEQWAQSSQAPSSR